MVNGCTENINLLETAHLMQMATGLEHFFLFNGKWFSLNMRILMVNGKWFTMENLNLMVTGLGQKSLMATGLGPKSLMVTGLETPLVPPLKWQGCN